MAKSNKVSLPASYGGLMRFSETESKFLIPPESVVAIVGAVIVIELVLHSGSLFF